MCRLSQPSVEVRKLGEHLVQTMLKYGDLSFVVREQSGLKREETGRQLLERRVIEGMIRDQEFCMERLAFEVKNTAVPIHIDLHYGSTAFSISGFPRLLIMDTANANIARSHTRAQDSSSLNRFGTPSPKPLRKASTWEPPSLLEREGLPDLRAYGDSERDIGLGLSSQGQTCAGQTQRNESSQAEASMWKIPDATYHGLAPQWSASPSQVPTRSAPASPGALRSAPQQPASEHISTSMALSNGLRNFLSPTRASPSRNGSAASPKADKDDVSQTRGREDGHYSGFSLSLDPNHARGAHGLEPSRSLPSSSSTIDCYHADSARNEMRHPREGIVPPDMRRWQSLNGPRPGLYLQTQNLSATELIHEAFPAELPGDFVQRVELP